MINQSVDNFINSKSIQYDRALENYFINFFRAQDRLKDAISTSTSELATEFKKINKDKKSHRLDYMRLCMNLVESTSWISKSALDLAIQSVSVPTARPEFSQGDEHERIIDYVISGKKGFYSHEQVFKAIFEELSYFHLSPEYKTKLKFPKPNFTIALVPGVVNELYKTAPFERGVQNICKLYGLEYLVLKVSGAKNAAHNAQLLEEQILTFNKQNPDKKLWLFTYSKGGIDTLHYLKKNPKLSEEIIEGLSCIATPIMGNHRTNHPLLKLISPKELIAESKLNQILKINKHRAIHPVKKSLSDQYQANWFKKNHKELPKIFYTSVALEARWYQSHVWMILAKILFQSKNSNDGVVDAKDAKFPDYFRSFHFGEIKGHHLIGLRYSLFNQEALIEAHLIMMHYLGLYDAK